MVSTSAGGLLALRYRDRLGFLLAFSAGVLLGVVAFDLLPESIALLASVGGDARELMAALAGGFVAFHALGRFRGHGHGRNGVVSCLGLLAHSLMDGAGIGLAFQVSAAAGIAVAIAVVAHDFCDGLSTVSVMLAHGNTIASSLGMLALNAAAPVAGALLTLAFTPGPGALLLYMAFAAGFLLHIAAADILPLAHARVGPAAAAKLIPFAALGACSAFAFAHFGG